jgi:hypothetical protein
MERCVVVVGTGRKLGEGGSDILPHLPDHSEG